MVKDKELYKKRYDIEKIKDNVFELVEATGYLQALIDAGCNDEWVHDEMMNITLRILSYTL